MEINTISEAVDWVCGKISDHLCEDKRRSTATWMEGVETDLKILRSGKTVPPKMTTMNDVYACSTSYLSLHKTEKE